MNPYLTNLSQILIGLKMSKLSVVDFYTRSLVFRQSGVPKIECNRRVQQEFDIENMNLILKT